MDLIDVYKVTRGQIEHVDNTISQRTIWLMISQSFFFSGYAVLVTGNPEDPWLLDKQHSLLMIFPIAALVVNIVSLFDIISGSIYQKKLRTDFNMKRQQDVSDVPFPPIEGFRMLNQMKNFSTLALPVVLIVIWITVLTG